MIDTIRLFHPDINIYAPPSEYDYNEAIKNNEIYIFDTETSLIKKDSNIYVDIPEFVLGVEIAGNILPLMKDYSSWFFDQCKRSTKHNFIIIGHNLPFDLNVVGYIPGHETMLWDTALAHYLFTHQRDTFPSLETVAKYWLGTTDNKESEVSEMIKAGIDPRDIPKDKLEEYCKKDVELTRDIALKQFDYFQKQEKKYQNMIINQMNWLKNIYRMSKIGLKLDTGRIKDSIHHLNNDIDILEDKCKEYMVKMFHEFTHGKTGYELNFTVNPMSNKQIETIVYGGEFEIVTYEEVGIYKTGTRAGQVKYKKNISKIIVPSVHGSHSVDSKAIKNIRNTTTKGDFADFLDNLLELRDLTKTKSTYFIGYSEQADNNGVIHSEMKHVGTPTGRLSSTKPNIQNLKGDE